MLALVLWKGYYIRGTNPKNIFVERNKVLKTVKC
jgi:hypothetical protein